MTPMTLFALTKPTTKPVISFIVGSPVICIPIDGRQQRNNVSSNREAHNLFCVVFRLRFMIVTYHQALRPLFIPSESMATSAAAVTLGWCIASKHTSTVLRIDQAKRFYKTTPWYSTRDLLWRNDAASRD